MPPAPVTPRQPPPKRRARITRAAFHATLRTAEGEITVIGLHLHPHETLASLVGQKVEEAMKVYQCAKVTLLASLNGYAPALAVEFGRKVLYSTERPTFTELESHVKGKK